MGSQLNVSGVVPRSAGPEGGRVSPKVEDVAGLAIMPRDPAWLHAYWGVPPGAWAKVEKLFGRGVRKSGRPVLRFSAGGKGVAFETGVKLGARNWYVRMPERAGQWKAELGLRLPNGRFALLAASNEIWMPAGRASEPGVKDEGSPGEGLSGSSWKGGSHGEP